MKKALILLCTALTLLSCREGKVATSYGKLIPEERGFTLPMAKEPGKKATEYVIRVSFTDEEVELRSPEMLHACYLSFAYTRPETGAKDMHIVDLDFQDRIRGEYIYSLPYFWFPSAKVMENTFQTAIYYAPERVALPNVEIPDEDGNKIMYPDFSGYMYLFNGDETRTWFKALFR